MSEDSAGDLPPEVRRDELTAYVNRVRRARVEDLAEIFGVSAMTIHRDLDQLAAAGRIERIRGGARALTAQMHETDVQLRRVRNVESKRRLAATAAELIAPGAVIALDDSTTVGMLAEHLGVRKPSTVITHSLPLMSTIAALPEVALVGLGGQYFRETDSFLGSVVIEQMRRLLADIVFVSTTSVKNLALLHPDAEAALTKQSLLNSGARKVLLVDSSKFDAPGLYHVMDLAEFDDVIVDSGLGSARLAELETLDLRVHVVESKG